MKWGIISTGTIAHNFAKTVAAMSGETEVYAVASRSQESAQAFADQYGIKKAYASYEELVHDDNVDIVYVATPHSLHYENMMLCLEHGKNILCEKSFTVTAEQAGKIYNVAKEKNLFVMEGFWTKYLPIYRDVEKLINDGVIGDIHMVTAQYGYCTAGSRTARKFDPALAGGTLLDIGVYAIGFAAMMLGYQPKSVQSLVKLNDVGTDEYSTILMQYENGAIAQLTTAIQITIPVLGCVYGSKGYLIIPEFKNPNQIQVILNDGTSYTIDKEVEINGFEYEIREAERCLLEKCQYSQILTPDQSVAVMKIMDQVRDIWNMKFPFEK